MAVDGDQWTETIARASPLDRRYHWNRLRGVNRTCVDVSGLIADVVTRLQLPCSKMRARVSSSGAASHLWVTQTIFSDSPNLPMISVAGGSREQIRTPEAMIVLKRVVEKDATVCASAALHLKLHGAGHAYATDLESVRRVQTSMAGSGHNTLRP